MAAGDALGNILMEVAESLADNYDSDVTPPNKDQILAETGRQIGEAAKAKAAFPENGGPAMTKNGEVAHVGG